MTQEVDWPLQAQKAAEAHLAACEEAQFAWEENADSEVESPASAPFCGCNTCVVREVLFAAWPILEKWAIAEATPTLADTIDAKQFEAMLARLSDEQIGELVGNVLLGRPTTQGEKE